MISRKRYSIFYDSGVESDFAEIGEDEELETELMEMVRKPLHGELKGGRLLGWRSWNWSDQGRIIYRIKDGELQILALSRDHDEAYRKAQKRMRKYG